MTREVAFEDLGVADLIVDAIYRGGRRGNSGDDPISNLLPVGNMGGFRYSGRSVTGVRICVLYSELSDPDWPDALYPELGRFFYFGDNKTPGHELHDTPRKGNLILRDAFTSLHQSRRHEISPFLVFTKAGHGRDVVFRGLAAPGGAGLSASEDLIAIWRTKSSERFQNYRAIFTILDVPSVPREWLVSLCGRGERPAHLVPKPWVEWVRSGSYDALLAPRVRRFRTPEEQLPLRDGDRRLLKALHAYFGRHPDGPYAFESCAAEIVKRMDTNVISVDLTRPWRDGGRDGVGRYRIGTRNSALAVEFALEAKCKTPSPRNSSGVRDTSRLVSRLRHRQFGVFVTTSCVGRQAYEELTDDEHPVLILAGIDIVEILRAAGIDTEERLVQWLQVVAPMDAPVTENQPRAVPPGE